MKRASEWLKNELLFIVAVVLFTWAFITSPELAVKALQSGLKTCMGVLPILTAVFGAIGLFNVLVDRKKVADALGENSGIKAMVLASLAGTILVGPVYVVFPLMKAVREHGARWAVVGAVLAAWAVKIPMVPMEIGMLGVKFSAARVVLVAVAAIPIGFLLEWVMSRGSSARP